MMHVLLCCMLVVVALQDGPVWLQLNRLVNTPERQYEVVLRHLQRHAAEVQQLHSQVAGLEQQLLQARALDVLPSAPAQQ